MYWLPKQTNVLHALPTAFNAISMVHALHVPQHTLSVVLDHVVHALKNVYLVIPQMSVINALWGTSLQVMGYASHALITVNTAKTL